MSAPEIEGPASEAAYDAKMIADLRAHRPMMTGHVVRLDLEELDALLRAAAERDELKAAVVEPLRITAAPGRLDAADAALKASSAIMYAVEAEATEAAQGRARSGAWCRYCGHYIVSDAGAPWRHLAPASETGYHPAEPKA